MTQDPAKEGSRPGKSGRSKNHPVAVRWSDFAVLDPGLEDAVRQGRQLIIIEEMRSLFLQQQNQPSS